MAQLGEGQGVSHPSRRWCYATLQQSDGTPLMRCARCHAAYYSSKEAQKAHWPLHKQSCSAEDPAVVAEIRSLKLGQAVERMWSEMARPTRHTAHVIDQIKALCGLMTIPGVRQAKDRSDAILHLHGYARCFLPEHQHFMLMKKLWAAPGVPERLLDESLYSQSRRKQIEVYGSAEAIPQLRWDKVSGQLHKQRNRDRSAMDYAYLIFNLLVRTAVGGVERCNMSAHDGIGFMRDSPLSRVAGERALELFVDPAVREDCGDSLLSAMGFVRSLWSSVGPEEKTRLIHEKGLLRAILEELQQQQMCMAVHRYANDVLQTITDEQLTAMPDDQAVDLLMYLQDVGGMQGDGFDMDGGMAWDLPSHETVTFKPFINRMVQAVLGPPERRLRLVEEAYTRSHFLRRPATRWTDIEKCNRMFFYLFAEALRASKQPMKVSMKAVREEWSKMILENPKSLRHLAILEVLGPGGADEDEAPDDYDDDLSSSSDEGDEEDEEAEDDD